MSIAPLLALKDGWMSSPQIIQISVIMPLYYDIPSLTKTDRICRRQMESSSPEESSYWDEKGLGKPKYEKLSKYKPL